jgi:lipooligosaccharide transport system ATP-binding protein
VSEQPLIYARGLVKRFGEFTAVDGIDLEVAPGEAFGFLGPNGAGKSSTMRMISCVSLPTAGELRILGMDPSRDGTTIRGRLGVCPQLDNLDPDLSVRENLTTYARYFGIPRRWPGAGPRSCSTSCSWPTGPAARSSRCRVA